MKLHALRRLLSVGMLIFLSVSMSEAQTQARATIHTGEGKHTISRHIYGHFAEHLGRCIYDGFYVGENNTKIAHKDGIRMDVVDALRKIRIPNLRWPGGCFADTYHWMDGIGPKDKRPTIVNTWWGGVTEDNSFGTHDFLNMCELLGAEPYLSANVGSGTVKEMSDWIQYTNFDGVSPMSALRKENGREKSWGVKYWGVGNEAWGCGGNMRAEYYADVYRQYATFMSDWGNTSKIFRIASGASSNDYHWTEVLMRDVPHSLLEGVALHHYSVIDWNAKGPAANFSDEQYFTIMKRALEMEELVTRHSTIMDRYDPQKKVALVVDEWGGWYDVEPGTNPGFLFQQNTMRDAMIAGATLNIFNNHADRVRMANLAQAVNVLQAVILTKEEKLVLTPTYHVMEMYTVHHDATLLPVSLSNAGNFSFGKEKLPALSVSASRKDGVVSISIVNIDPKQANPIALELSGTAFKNATARILRSDKVQDHNTFDNPNKVKPVAFKDVKLKQNTVELTAPPCSVIVIELR